MPAVKLAARCYAVGKGWGNCSSCPTVPHAATYLPSRRATWLPLVSAVSAFDTDISPDLSPLSPIFSRISPRVRPWPSLMTCKSCSRLLPLRARGARRCGSAELAGCLAGLRRFVGVDRAQLVVDGGELALKLVLLVEDRLALGVKPLAISRDEVLERVRHSYPPMLVGGLVDALPTFVQLNASARDTSSAGKSRPNRR